MGCITTEEWIGVVALETGCHWEAGTDAADIGMLGCCHCGEGAAGASGTRTQRPPGTAAGAGGAMTTRGRGLVNPS